MSDFSQIPTAYPQATGFDSVYVAEIATIETLNMLGVATLAFDAELPLEAVTLQQMNAAIGGGPFLPLAGGTEIGQVFVNVTDPPLNQGGGAGGISPAMAFNVASSPGSTNLFPWAISSVFTSGSTGVGGAHQEGGVASQVVKLGGSNAATWQFFGNTKEISGRGFPNGTGANVAGEFNLLCNGPDNPTSAFNPNVGFRAYFNLASRTYKPHNWTPNTTYALNVSTQPTGAPPWAANTSYSVGVVVLPTVPGNWAFRCIVAGTSGGTEPTWPIVPGSTVVDGGVTWQNINNAGNGYTYFCTAAGTSGATEPIWPTAPGTVVDGTVIWQYGATLDTQISRVIAVGDSDNGAVSYGAVLLVTSPVYDAILEFSGATLDTTFNPNAAAIRLAREMPIDFSGNLTSGGQNNHTLRYTTSGSGNQRLSYQVAAGELVQFWDLGISIFGNNSAANSVLTMNCVAGGARQLRFQSGGGARWTLFTDNGTESGANAGSNLQWLAYADDGTTPLGAALSINRATRALCVGDLSAPTITSGSAVPSSTQPKGSIYMRASGGVGSTFYVSQGGGTWNAAAGV